MKPTFTEQDFADLRAKLGGDAEKWILAVKQRDQLAGTVTTADDPNPTGPPGSGQ